MFIYIMLLKCTRLKARKQSVCWLRACLTGKVMAMPDDRIQRLLFVFVTRRPKVQDVSLDFEEFFRLFGCRREKVRLHNLTELAICYSSSITQYFNFGISMLLTQIS